MKRLHSLTLVLFLAATAAASDLESVPGTFDFGWSPDNARVSCEFLVRNKGGDAVNLTGLKPSCGCTAAQFTPTALGTNADTTIGLTFNTRGYKGIQFTKTALLNAADPSQNLTVTLTGFPMNPNAKVFPEGTGIADFGPDTKSDKQIIKLQNKTGQNVTLSIIQHAAAWASVDVTSNDTIEIKAKKPFTDIRETSVTFEAKEPAGASHRFTIAIRTGPPQKAYEPLRPTATPNDPLKLKGVEPQK